MFGRAQLQQNLEFDYSDLEISLERQALRTGNQDIALAIGTKANPYSAAIRSALRIRAFETRLLTLFAEGRIRGTVHTCLGQELLATIVVDHMEDQDVLFGGHRAHGYFLAKSEDYIGLMREILGKANGVSNGVGGSQHLHWKNFYTNGVQGGLMPIAVGASSALKEGIAIAVIGDGTLGQGVLYESLNVASLQQLPMLVIIEDNGISQSTPQQQAMAGDLLARFEAFGWHTFSGTDLELDELVTQIQNATSYVRTSRKPAALRLETRRLGPHSKGDDNRPSHELEALSNVDLLNRAIEASETLAEEWEDAQEFIENLVQQVLTEQPAQLNPHDQRDVDVLRETDPWKLSVQADTQPVTIRGQTQWALHAALESNRDAWLIGEDVETLPPGMEKPYSGAFGVSQDLSKHFDGRVRNFPISEQAIVGFAIGRALMGLPTIAEVMFGDFTTLIVDQVRQQASKLTGIYSERIQIPLVIRTPMGGRRGYGPTHSQSIEGLFLGIPNVIAFAVSPFGIQKNLFLKLLNFGLPVMLFENKDLYVLESRKSVPRPYEIHEPLTMRAPYRVSPSKLTPQVTVVTYGYAAELVIRAVHKLAVEREIFADVLVFQVISPLDPADLAKSLTRTRKLLIVEEGIPSSGITSEVISQLSRIGHDFPIQISNLGAAGDIGASAASEEWALISEEKIIRAIEFLEGGARD
jgi:2-oxoisovalerate dehydrogenase E1 component